MGRYGTFAVVVFSVRLGESFGSAAGVGLLGASDFGFLDSPWRRVGELLLRVSFTVVDLTMAEMILYCL